VCIRVCLWGSLQQRPTFEGVLDRWITKRQLYMDIADSALNIDYERAPEMYAAPSTYSILMPPHLLRNSGRLCCEITAAVCCSL